jgi:anthranilate phosphoribosyltransferase
MTNNFGNQTSVHYINGTHSLVSMMGQSIIKHGNNANNSDQPMATICVGLDQSHKIMCS